MIGNHEKSSSMEGRARHDFRRMEGRILFDRGRVELAPPTRIILLTIFFIFISTLFPLSAQEKKDTNDTEVNVLSGNTTQDGKVAEEGAKKFLADTVKSEGKAPEKVIKLTKSFTPPKGYSFRPFIDPGEVDKYQIAIARHPRMDKIGPGVK